MRSERFEKGKFTKKIRLTNVGTRKGMKVKRAEEEKQDGKRRGAAGERRKGK